MSSKVTGKYFPFSFIYELLHLAIITVDAKILISFIFATWNLCFRE